MVFKLGKLSLRPHQIFVIRATRPGFIPVFLKKLMKHRFILNMGCTPFSTIEKNAFYTNPSYKPKHRILTKIHLPLLKIIKICV